VVLKTIAPETGAILLDGEGVPSLGAAAGKHCTSRFGLHATKETVFALSFDLLRAESSDFHRWSVVLTERYEYRGILLCLVVQVNIYAGFSTCYKHPVHVFIFPARLRDIGCALYWPHIKHDTHVIRHTRRALESGTK
jgi:hypothetical protein